MRALATIAVALWGAWFVGWVYADEIYAWQDRREMIAAVDALPADVIRRADVLDALTHGDEIRTIPYAITVGLALGRRGTPYALAVRDRMQGRVQEREAQNALARATLRNMRAP